MVAGKGPVTEPAEQALAQIDKLIERTGALPVQMQAQEAKKLVQQLDSAIDYGVRNGAFSSETSQALQRLRRGVDAQLKTVPGYAEKMKEASEYAKMLELASENYGTPQKAVSTLNQIAGRTSGLKRDALGALGSATGRDFLSPVDEYIGAQSKLKSPQEMEKIRSGLPEFGQARKAELHAGEMARPEAAPEFISSELNKTGLPSKRQAAQGAVQEAETGLLGAKEKLEPFSSLGPYNTQNAVKGLLKKPGAESIELRKKMQALSDVTGKDFTGWINDKRLAQQFEGEYRIGSRNVNLGAIIGSLAGPKGAALGAAAGAQIDRFGPQIAGAITDAIRTAKGPQIYDKIMSLNIPPEAKQAALMELHQFASSNKSDDGLLKKK
jgi:hypothetical protein